MTSLFRPHRTAHRATVALALAAALTGPVLVASVGAGAASTAPKVTGAWARTSPAGATMGAAYLTITSPVADKLVSASVPATVAATVELHETVMVTTTAPKTTMAAKATTTKAMGGMEGMEGMDMSGSMTMRPVKFIALPAGKAVSLKPGGYHVMLINLKAPLKTGTSIKLTLKFEKAAAMTLTVPVKEG